jgi:UTP--glucose-1-phosphate uridylyltransferase
VHNQQVQCRGFVEKPKPEQAPSTLAVMGRYIFTPTIFDEIENLNVGAGGEYQLTDAMHKLAQKQPFHGFVLQGERFDCGDKVGFQMANLHFAMKDEFIAPRLLPFMQALAMQYDRRSEVRKKVV